MTTIRHNPAGVFPPYRAYAHATEVRGDARLLFVSGLNGYEADGKTLPESFDAQAELIWKHLRTILRGHGVRRPDDEANVRMRVKHLGTHPGVADGRLLPAARPALEARDGGRRARRQVRLPGGAASRRVIAAQGSSGDAVRAALHHCRARRMADSEDLDDDDVPSGPGRRYLTRAGAERMHAELLRLLNEERPRVTAEVSAAAAQGDRSENAEYIYGKKRLREIDRRIRFLQKRLDTSTIVSPEDQTDTGRVWFGAWVTLEDEEGTERTYQIVGPDEIDARGTGVSVESPLGRSLLGKRPGDEVTVRRPRGEVELVVRTIRYRRDAG
jgi:transcription elongation factor GreB